MQTAVEFLFEKLWNTDKDKFTWYFILEQAKKMEKQQIIDALTYGNKSELMASQKMFAEQYYNETYGSKGSDDHVPDVRKMVSSQTEISDEEMIQAAIKHSEIFTLKFIPRSSFIDGAKWYREQLKSKGNGETK